MSLNEKDIVFRWVDNSEITKCKVGNCRLNLDFTIRRQDLIRMGLNNYFDGDLRIRCRFTKAFYNLESSNKKNISVKEYLSVSKGVGGQYSGWLEYKSAASKVRLLNCTLDHQNTFGQNRKLVYFPFVDCKNSYHLRGRKKEELQKLCSYPFNLEICKLINNLPLEQPFPEDIEHVQNLTRLSANSEVEQDDIIIYPENNKIKYASLGSLMPLPYTNNCEVDFVGNIKIPVLILEQLYMI